MTSLLQASRDRYRAVFTRDGFRCVYCDRDILETLDTFAASHLDHLKPRRTGGTEDAINCVTACGVCNLMKGGWDPSSEGPVTEETFHSVVARARAYVTDKRNGNAPCGFVRDYQGWLKKAGRDG